MARLCRAYDPAHSAMKEQISTKLATQLGHLSPDQLNDLIRRAAHLRRRANDKNPLLDVWIQRVLQKERRTLDRAANVAQATVASVYPHEALVSADGETVIASTGFHAPVVGDRVRIGRLEDQLVILEVEERRTRLSRPDVDTGGERLIAANFDVVVIVVSVVAPPLHPRLIDRYLIAVQNGGAAPVICVNKIDLLQDPSELEALNPYAEGGVPVLRVSAAHEHGVAGLREEVRGKTVVFVGHSGVGKSSLMNAFAGLSESTGSVSAGYGRGTHTTTVSSLHQLPDGTVLIDTPGIRSFGLWAVKAADVAAAFPEIQDAICRFRNCSHTSEPGCGVLQAIAEGRMAPARYEAMRRLHQEVARSIK